MHPFERVNMCNPTNNTTVILSNGTNGSVGNGVTIKDMHAAQSYFSILKERLVTEEDFLHLHKISGILVLISFLYRMTLLFDDMGFVSHPALTLPTIFVHWLLPITAFQFRIPKRRIRDGARIWPEYRWHAFAFTSRSCLCLLVYYYEHIHQLPPSYWINYLLLMANMMGADLATWYYGSEYSSKSVREIQAPGFVKFFLSVMQFNASVAILLGVRSFAMPFFMLYTVQLTPFIGTLRRKGLFNSIVAGGALYISFLVGGFTVQSLSYHKAGGELLHLVARSLVILAALLRLSPFPKFLWPLQNKYVIWTIMYAIVSLVRPILFNDAVSPAFYAPSFLRSMITDVVQMRITVAMLFSTLLLSCYIKVRSGYYPKDVKEAKQVKKL